MELTAEELQQLKRLACRRNRSQALALRARIVLDCASGLSNSEMAARLRVSKPMISNWRERFRVHRVEGLHDAPRAGTPHLMSDE